MLLIRFEDIDTGYVHLVPVTSVLDIVQVNKTEWRKADTKIILIGNGNNEDDTYFWTDHYEFITQN